MAGLVSACGSAAVSGRTGPAGIVDAFDQLAISRDGLSVVVNPMVNGGSELLLLDSQGAGRILSLPGDYGTLVSPSFSPDGARILMVAQEAGPRTSSRICEIDLAAGVCRHISAPFDYVEAPFHAGDGQIGFFGRSAGGQALAGQFLNTVDGAVRPIDDHFRFQSVTKARLFASGVACDGIRGGDPFEVNALDEKNNFRRAHLLGVADEEVGERLAEAALRLRTLRLFGVTGDDSLIVGSLADGTIARVASDGVTVLSTFPGMSGADVGATEEHLLIGVLDPTESDWQRSKRLLFGRSTPVRAIDVYQNAQKVEIG